MKVPKELKRTIIKEVHKQMHLPSVLNEKTIICKMAHDHKTYRVTSDPDFKYCDKKFKD
jgi:hypothetical protein